MIDVRYNDIGYLILCIVMYWIYITSVYGIDVYTSHLIYGIDVYTSHDMSVLGYTSDVKKGYKTNHDRAKK
jgi:hypothetical protein